MAVSKRCIPTRFFKDPDIVDLSKDAQLILIGLVLNADDEGREYAHAKVLGQEMDYPPEHIEAVLQELSEQHLIVLYEVGRHRYYQLTQQWQNLGSKATPSKFPAPEHFPESSRKIPENSGNLSESPAQEKRREEKLTQENAAEGNTTPANITPFPSKSGGGGGEVVSLNENEIDQQTRDVAKILRLEATPALRRVVADFLGDTALSLTGEADMAREYIDDPKRNHRHKTMSPAFYRQWLKRERDQPRPKSGQNPTTLPAGQATGTDSTHPPGPAFRSLMNLEAEYQRHTNRRAKDEGGGLPARNKDGGADG